MPGHNTVPNRPTPLPPILHTHAFFGHIPRPPPTSSALKSSAAPAWNAAIISEKWRLPLASQSLLRAACTTSVLIWRSPARTSPIMILMAASCRQTGRAAGRGEAEGMTTRRRQVGGPGGVGGKEGWDQARRQPHKAVLACQARQAHRGGGSTAAWRRKTCLGVGRLLDVCQLSAHLLHALILLNQLQGGRQRDRQIGGQGQTQMLAIAAVQRVIGPCAERR